MTTVPRAINRAGQVAGYSSTGTANHAFRWTASGGMVDIGTLGGTSSYAYGINELGQICGYSYITGNTAYHAFDGMVRGCSTSARSAVPIARRMTSMTPVKWWETLMRPQAPTRSCGAARPVWSISGRSRERLLAGHSVSTSMGRLLDTLEHQRQHGVSRGPLDARHPGRPYRSGDARRNLQLRDRH